MDTPRGLDNDAGCQTAARENERHEFKRCSRFDPNPLSRVAHQLRGSKEKSVCFIGS